MQQINHSENTTPIMYIGPKAIKRDTVTGFKPELRFVRNQPENVPYSVAQALLGFDCFVIATPESFEAAKKKEHEEAEAAEAAKKLAEEEALKELDKGDTVLEVDGESIDVGKFTSSQLATFVEAQDLEIQQKSQEKVGDFALRVRDTYRAKQVSE
ncbi:hypothetical protein VPHD85_0007 [Vibrio phage D85]|nr:hypothetical protein PODOV033v1_p0067 [Vibrio phage 252E42.2]